MHKNPNVLVLLILLLIGALVGAILGEALKSSVPLLARAVAISLPATDLNLVNVLKVTFGFQLKLNVASAIGIVLALLVYRQF